VKLRTLEEIERDEAGRGTTYPVTAPSPTMEDLRPGPIKSLLLGIGDLLIAVPKLLLRLLGEGIGLAVILGVVGCIVFGLVYLFG
jgi:hypothetical protein